jgi:hypothetical protein
MGRHAPAPDVNAGRPRRICLVDGPFAPFFTARGDQTLSLSPAQGVHDIAALLDERGFTPDLLLHTEVLGRKVVLRGVEDLPCPTAFWSVDTHMNSHWQAHYGALFDAVFTSQKHLTGDFRRGGGHEAFWLPWFGSARPMRPFARRGTPVGFVGRLGAGRPVREHFVRLLQSRFAAKHAAGLSEADMQAFYDDTCLAPNEALFGEVNFRVFETAASGALCLTPRVPGMDELFRHGREAICYETGEDMAERLDYFLGRPDEAETVARAGHAAIAARHLPSHRWQALCACLEKAPGRARGEAAQTAFALTGLGLMEAGLFGHLAPEAEASLARLSARPEAAGGLLRLWRLTGRKNQILLLATALAALPGLDPLLAATAALSALEVGAFPLARTLARGLARGLAAPGRNVRPRPLNAPRDICLFAAAIFRDAGRIMRPGLVFDPKRHAPQSVVEALIYAHILDPADTAVIVALEAAMETLRGVENTRLGLLSALSLREPENWRWPLRLALVNARLFRLEESAQEMALARDMARRAGQQRGFDAMRDGLFPATPPGA